MINIKKILGANIRDLRESLSLSQDSFGEKIGLSGKTISQIETGKYFTTSENIQEICNVYNINPSLLFSINPMDIRNISGEKEEVINDINILLSSLDEEKIESVYAFLRFISDKNINLKRNK